MASAPEPVVLASPALHGGRVEVVPKAPSRSRRFHTRRYKDALIRGLYPQLDRVPPEVLRAGIRGGGAALKLVQAIPQWPVSRTAEALARIASRRDIPFAPGEVARRFVDNCTAMLENILALHREGADAVVDRITFRESDVERFRRALDAHGGAVCAVTHNPGSVFAAIALARLLPTLVITKNSSSVGRTRMALDFYERMGITVLMVRGGNPVELTRVCLRALKEKKVVVATLDAIYRPENRVVLRMLDADVGLAPWAARLAARSRVPIFPTYVTSRGRDVVGEIGPEYVPAGIEDGMRHYVDYFEDRILREPASWSFLADKRWRWALVRAAGLETSPMPD